MEKGGSVRIKCGVYVGVCQNSKLQVCGYKVQFC